MKKRIKVITGALAIFLATTFFSGYFYLVYQNNIDTASADRLEVEQALHKSIDWVLTNQDSLIEINNPVLWWFLDESARLTGNGKLENLVSRYRREKLGKNSVWTGYWVRNPPFTYIPGMLDSMEKYQKFFIYGMTCDSDLGEESDIKEQLDINFCNWKPYYSSCSTHQLMTIRMLISRDCGDIKQLKQLSTELERNIETQIARDPRIGDVFMQRVLLLLENNKPVKPVWIKNILKEQRPDGGWANFYRLFNITDTWEFGFGYKYPEIRKSPQSSFHTTAQAIYLLSMVLNRKPE